VRLIDHEQPDAFRDHRQHLVAEALVREPLGRDEEQVDLVVAEPFDDRHELVGVRAVDRLGPHAEPGRHLDLVAHQGEEGGDQEGGAGVLLAQELRGDEVDGGLAPPGALDEEDAASVAGDRLDRCELAWAEVGGGAEHAPQVL
jgi:hypothetical protein